MSVELIGVLIAVVAVGVTLAGLMLTGQRAIRAELAAQRREFSTELAAQCREFSAELAEQRREFSAELAEQRRELAAMRTDFGDRFTALEQQIAELRAHLEGLLDGLREAIAIQRGAA